MFPKVLLNKVLIWICSNENMRDIFPYSASYDDEDWKERVWAWILYYVVSEDALKYCGEEDEDED